MLRFISFLSEMPQINTYHSKNLMNKMADQSRDIIKNSNEKESHIGDGIYRKNIDDDYVYYKKDSNGNNI